jgi:hypothetical protein
MQHSFEPHEIALFRRVIDVVCAEMGRCDTGTEIYIAHRILCRAQRGNWDFSILLCAARLETETYTSRQMEMVH